MASNEFVVESGFDWQYIYDPSERVIDYHVGRKWIRVIYVPYGTCRVHTTGNWYGPVIKVIDEFGDPRQFAEHALETYAD